MFDRAQLRQWLAWNVRETICVCYIMRSLAIPLGPGYCAHIQSQGEANVITPSRSVSDYLGNQYTLYCVLLWLM